MGNELEEHFRYKKINWYQQVWTPNWHPHHDITQSYRGSKSTCIVGIGITKTFHDTQGQVSVSTNADEINEKTKVNNKKVSLGRLTWNIFYINEKIDWFKQLWTTNLHPHHDLLQDYWGGQYTCLV